MRKYFSRNVLTSNISRIISEATSPDFYKNKHTRRYFMTRRGVTIFVSLSVSFFIYLSLSLSLSHSLVLHKLNLKVKVVRTPYQRKVKTVRRGTLCLHRCLDCRSRPAIRVSRNLSFMLFLWAPRAQIKRKRSRKSIFPEEQFGSNERRETSRTVNVEREFRTACDYRSRGRWNRSNFASHRATHNLTLSLDAAPILALPNNSSVNIPWWRRSRAETASRRSLSDRAQAHFRVLRSVLTRSRNISYENRPDTLGLIRANCAVLLRRVRSLSYTAFALFTLNYSTSIGLFFFHTPSIFFLLIKWIKKR